MQIDARARQDEAVTIAAALVGPEALGRLVQVMLDHEVPPAFMWRGIAKPLDTEADALRAQLASALDAGSMEARVRSVLEGIPGLERDDVKALLQLATWQGYFALPDTLLSAPSVTSRVFSAVPQLRDRLDDRGLLDLARLRATPGALFVGEYALSYHQLLRRAFGSHVNDALIGHLLRLQRADGLALRAAIDDRRLRLARDYRVWLERDYWFGPHLSEKVLDGPEREPSTLVHRWGDPDDPRRLFDSSEEFSIRLSREGGTRTIEAEEVVAPERATSSSGSILVRYLHAQRDTSRHMFVHCDGAVRAYLPYNYALRRDSQGLPRNDKDLVAQYRKVFRVDGDIATDDWSQIVALWFRGNNLAIEALDDLADTTTVDGASP
jgi:hypothetical protein